jgi:hypothetical protein
MSMNQNEPSIESSLLLQLDSMESTLRESFLLSQFPLLESELSSQQLRNLDRLERLTQRISELDNDVSLREKRILRMTQEAKSNEKREFEYAGIVSLLEAKVKSIELKNKNLHDELRHSKDTYFRHLSSCKGNGKDTSRSPDNLVTLCTDISGPTILVEMNTRVWDALKAYNPNLKQLADHNPASVAPEISSTMPIAHQTPPASPKVDRLRARVLKKSPSSPTLKRKPSKQFEHITSKVDSNYSYGAPIPIHREPIKSRIPVRSTSSQQDQIDRTVLLNIIHQQGVLLEQSLYNRQAVPPSLSAEKEEEEVDYTNSWRQFYSQRTEIAREWAKIAIERQEIMDKGGKLNADVLEFWNYKVFELFDRLGRIVEAGTSPSPFY